MACSLPAERDGPASERLERSFPGRILGSERFDPFGWAFLGHWMGSNRLRPSWMSLKRPSEGVEYSSGRFPALLSRIPREGPEASEVLDSPTAPWVAGTSTEEFHSSSL